GRVQGEGEEWEEGQAGAQEQWPLAARVAGSARPGGEGEGHVEERGEEEAEPGQGERGDLPQHDLDHDGVGSPDQDGQQQGDGGRHNVCLYARPPFMIKCRLSWFWKTRRSSRGLPFTTMRSAYLPGSTEPMRS